MSGFQGVVLAGGRSSRFGEDKAQALWQGQTFLEKVVSLLRKANTNPVVVTSRLRDYRFLACPVTRDILPEKGPLGGLYTVMKDFKDLPLLVLVCDMPVVTEEALAILMESHESDKDQATVFGFEGKELEPFPGIYDSSLCSQVLARILANRLSVRDFLESIPAKKIMSGSSVSEIFLNINEKKDLIYGPAPHMS